MVESIHSKLEQPQRSARLYHPPVSNVRQTDCAHDGHALVCAPRAGRIGIRHQYGATHLTPGRTATGLIASFAAKGLRYLFHVVSGPGRRRQSTPALLKPDVVQLLSAIPLFSSYPASRTSCVAETECVSPYLDDHIHSIAGARLVMDRVCPALMIAAPASGQGKTTVTAAMARSFARRGLDVRVFKCGPDFLDPTILARASGHAVHQVDLWMIGEHASRRLLWRAAAEADVILVEGVMGLYDGQPSAADLACCFDLPVMTVIDAGAMAQTFAAIVHGLATFRPSLKFAGVLANRVGSVRHASILRECLPSSIKWFGALPRTEDATLPSRHLGLVQATELADLDARLDAAADALEASMAVTLPDPVSFPAPTPEPTLPSLSGVRIGIARDEAFAFIYQANLDLLEAMGAEVVFFSPIHDSRLPDVDCVYLPGGYPELHLAALAGNTAVRDAICDHHAAGRPIVAECGGMLYLVEHLTDKSGETAPMLGLLPGTAHMQKRLAALALQSVELPEGVLRGHTFHHSLLTSTVAPLARGGCPNGRGVAEAVFRIGSLTASYIHFYFPSNPAAVAAMFKP